MPGIVGIIGATSVSSVDIFSKMLGRMKHEPCDRTGTYYSDSLRLRAGWVSHAKSFCDCLPVWNERKDACLIFTGETFEDPKEIQTLRTKGHHFDQGNGSYLIHLFEELGIEFLARLNGRFSGLLIDLREEKVVLFNDRYGLGRIYFHQNDEGFFFASEAKSLLSVLPETRRLDHASLAEVVSCGCVLQDRTLFNGIRLVPGGAKWTFHRSHPLRKDTYFRRESWENQPISS
jgi:asparagine synthase (glutamine-hydrolysing)